MAGDGGAASQSAVKEEDLAKLDLRLFKQKHDKLSKLEREMVLIPECLVGTDEEQRKMYEEDIEYFTCKSCRHIARNPELCRKCAQVFCADCTSTK